MTTVFLPDVAATGAPDQAGADRPIDTGGFFPAVDPARFRREQRVGEEITHDRVRQALVAAIIRVARDLADWVKLRRIEGAATLAAVATDLPTIDGEHPLVLLYRRAVSTAAKAEIVERYRDVDITGAGVRGAETLDSSVGELRRDSIHAIRDILGTGRTTIDLI